jgi:hypothetical protein
LPTSNAGNQTAVQDWKPPARTGNPIRGIAATTDKATLDVVITHDTEELVQIAVVMAGIPNSLFEAMDSLRTFLATEGTNQVQRALDGYVVDQIDAATPDNGSVGTSLIEQVRNAVASMRALGANPTSSRSTLRMRRRSTCPRPARMTPS